MICCLQCKQRYDGWKSGVIQKVIIVEDTYGSAKDSSKMTKEKQLKGHELDDEGAAVPFTARLNAYYRAEESNQANPLLIDPLAELLAGNMTKYFERHKRFTGMGGSQVARSYYIETQLLRPWCIMHQKSQIVLLGAGFDTRAYRLDFLQEGMHVIFELDLPIIIDYKERMLRKEQPLCNLVRIPTDLSKSEWKSKLRKRGFSGGTPTFWILEGLVYYLDRAIVHDLLRALSGISADNSQLFLDVCVPTLADMRWGPFTDHFKWGISMEDIPAFFATAGWNVSCSYLDDHSHGKDVGQKGFILVHGSREMPRIDESSRSSTSETHRPSSLGQGEFPRRLMMRIIPEIEEIIETYARNPERGLSTYIDFMKRTQPDLQTIAKGQKNPILLGKISPRLLGNPLSIERDAHGRTEEEIRSHIIGYLMAALQLAYCGVKGLDSGQYQDIPLYGENQQSSTTSRMDSLRRLLAIMKREFKI